VIVGIFGFCLTFSTVALEVTSFVGEINRVFGKNMVDYIRGLTSGHIDYLPRLPRSLLIRILRLIDLQDVPRISLVSKQFLEVMPMGVTFIGSMESKYSSSSIRCCDN